MKYTVSLYNKLSDTKPSFTEKFKTFQEASDYLDNHTPNYAKGDIHCEENGKSRHVNTMRGDLT